MTLFLFSFVSNKFLYLFTVCPYSNRCHLFCLFLIFLLSKFLSLSIYDLIFHFIFILLYFLISLFYFSHSSPFHFWAFFSYSTEISAKNFPHFLIICFFLSTARQIFIEIPYDNFDIFSFISHCNFISYVYFSYASQTRFILNLQQILLLMWKAESNSFLRETIVHTALETCIFYLCANIPNDGLMQAQLRKLTALCFCTHARFSRGR